MSPPRFSVVIATLDRAAFLREALEGLARLSGPAFDAAAFEVIVVEGPSRDSTAEMLAAFAGRIKRVSCEEANLSRARNLGLAQASGEIIAFLDDDAVPHPRWLTALATAFADPAVGCVGGYVIGRSGAEFQARKIICDRFGDSHFVADWFDERSLTPPASPIYPAPMGANIAFRRAALVEIGGFDEAFAYYLDETDVCLRLFDAGWRIVFAPEAFVWHQFAGSHLRDHQATPREMVTIARSKAYFAHRHGGNPTQAEARLAGFVAEKQGYVNRLCREGLIDAQTRDRLKEEITRGMVEGRTLAASPQAGARFQPRTPPAFLPFSRERARPLSLALVCRHYPPDSHGGIARWSHLAAAGLAARGASVHVLTQARQTPSIRFENGVWRHEILPVTSGHEALMDRFEMTGDTARWAAAVWLYLGVLASFGVEVLSFPIWDCEGIACFDDARIPIAVSLHTTSTLAGLDGVPPAGPAPRCGMAKAEACALEKADLILANSHAALNDIARISGVALAARAQVIAHGTPLGSPPADIVREGPLEVLFVGRAERRKGYDIALLALERALDAGANLHARFAGGHIRHAVAERLVERGALTLLGELPREALDALFRAHDVLVMPSRYESFGLVAIEAMAQGTPVLASAVGGLGEVIQDGHDGHLVPPGEAGIEPLAAHLLRLSHDKAALAALSRHAYASAQARFGVETMCEGLEAAYLSLREKHR